MINIKLGWPPTINTYWRSVRRGNRQAVLLSEKGRKYKETSYWEMAEQGTPKGIEGRVELLIDAYPPDRRHRDLDNILKPILDVLEDYGVFVNDRQVDIILIRRRHLGGHVQIHVAEIPPEDSLTN